MIKKINILFIIVISMLLLTSCAIGGRVFSDDGLKADSRMEKIIEAIQNKDKEKIKVMFSKQALDDVENIDEHIDYLFGFIQGKIISWERSSGMVDENNNYGRDYKKSEYRYFVNTEKGQYYFKIMEYLVDSKNPKNVGGLYMIKVLKSEDNVVQYDFEDEYRIECAGIYRPEDYMPKE